MPKNTEFEVNKELVLSCVHISNESRLLLNANLIVNNYSSDDCNFRLLVDSLKLERNELPNELNLLAEVAISRDCKWLLFDCDGPIVSSLDTFIW